MKNPLLLPAILLLISNFLLQSFSFAQGTWTQITNFGGAARWNAVEFAIGNKGYIGTGNYGGKDF